MKKVYVLTLNCVSDNGYESSYVQLAHNLKQKKEMLKNGLCDERLSYFHIDTYEYDQTICMPGRGGDGELIWIAKKGFKKI